MKLISKQKDYYDYVARDISLSDQSYIWKREPKVQVAEFDMPSPVYMSTGMVMNKRRYSEHTTEAIGFLVFFCGKVIPVAKIVESHLGQIKISYIFSFEGIPNVLINKDDLKTKRSGSFFYDYCPAAKMQALFALDRASWMSQEFKDSVKFKSGIVKPKMSLDDMHRMMKSPVFCQYAGVPETIGSDAEYVNSIYRSDFYQHITEIVVNPVLSAINMQKYMNPFTTFVEIERYVTNELAPKDIKRDMSVIEKAIPDKIKAESHGFNKYSFRKDPS